jgi:uncharacterized membrane protein
MGKGRVEAFSDGVLAIIITIMVLELKTPHEPTLEAVRPLLPVFASYVLSFIYVGIYWNNHHHMLHSVKAVNGPILWANLHLLFWLSLVPFTTAWMGEAGIATAPAAAYGGVLLMAAIAYFILQTLLARHEGPDSALAQAMGKDFKGKLSPVVYLTAIVVAFFQPLASVVLYVAVALIWFIPDRRIERQLHVR